MYILLMVQHFDATRGTRKAVVTVAALEELADKIHDMGIEFLSAGTW